MPLPRLTDPTLADIPLGTTSCEHCRTITWAGVPACACEFGRWAVDEEHVLALARPSDGHGQGHRPVAENSEIS
jgi:hypothetical protein